MDGYEGGVGGSYIVMEDEAAINSEMVEQDMGNDDKRSTHDSQRKQQMSVRSI